MYRPETNTQYLRPYARGLPEDTITGEEPRREAPLPRTIDADTHIDETEDTWEYMRPDEKGFKPVVAYPSSPDPNRPLTRYWMIDGERQPRLHRDDDRTRTTVEA